MIQTVEFGPLAPLLSKQLPGLKTPELWQKHADAIARLSVHGLLTDGETNKARIRLLKKMMQTPDAKTA